MEKAIFFSNAAKVEHNAHHGGNADEDDGMPLLRRLYEIGEHDQHRRQYQPPDIEAAGAGKLLQECAACGSTADMQQYLQSAKADRR